MGQRSQVYVRFEGDDGKKNLISRYFQWNFGERMVSRARYGIEWIAKNLRHGWLFCEEPAALIHILETNFDFVDVVLSSDIAKEYKEYILDNEDIPADKKGSFNAYAFYGQDNNDGILLIDIKGETIKYAFLSNEDTTPLNGLSYMDWDLNDNEDHDGCQESWRDTFRKSDVKTCLRNIAAIEKMATLMTKEEVESFVNDDYSYLFKEGKNEH